MGTAEPGKTTGLETAFCSFTLQTFHGFASLAGVAEAAWNTFLIALGNGIGVGVLSIVIPSTALKPDVRIRGFRVNRAADYTATIPLGLPPICHTRELRVLLDETLLER